MTLTITRHIAGVPDGDQRCIRCCNVILYRAHAMVDQFYALAIVPGETCYTTASYPQRAFTPPDPAYTYWDAVDCVNADTVRPPTLVESVQRQAETVINTLGAYIHPRDINALDEIEQIPLPTAPVVPNKANGPCWVRNSDGTRALYRADGTQFADVRLISHLRTQTRYSAWTFPAGFIMRAEYATEHAAMRACDAALGKEKEQPK